MATLPRLNEWGRVITYRQTQLGKLKKTSQVHLGVGTMSADDVLNYGADRVVLATGYHWCSDGRGANYGPIPGADASLPHVLTPTQVMQGKPVPGKRVLVLDGDGHFMGISLAEMHGQSGKQVTYVCDASDVAEYGVFTMESGNNKRMLFEKGIKTVPQSLGRAHRTRRRARSPTCTSSAPISRARARRDAAQGQWRRFICRSMPSSS